MTDMPELHPDELAMRVQWVIDKVWVTTRVRLANGTFYEYPPQVLEWPVEPRTTQEWLDIMSEATNLSLPSLRVR